MTGASSGPTGKVCAQRDLGQWEEPQVSSQTLLGLALASCVTSGLSLLICKTGVLALAISWAAERIKSYNTKQAPGTQSALSQRTLLY